MKHPDLISRVHEEIFGDPRVGSSRIPVLQILERLGRNESASDILRESPGLEREDLLACAAYAGEMAPDSRRPEFEQLLAKQFDPERRADRIRRASVALGRLLGSLKLDPKTLKYIAQDADLEEF